MVSFDFANDKTIEERSKLQPSDGAKTQEMCLSVQSTSTSNRGELDNEVKIDTDTEENTDVNALKIDEFATTNDQKRESTEKSNKSTIKEVGEVCAVAFKPDNAQLQGTETPNSITSHQIVKKPQTSETHEASSKFLLLLIFAELILFV